MLNGKTNSIKKLKRVLIWLLLMVLMKLIN